MDLQCHFFRRKRKLINKYPLLSSILIRSKFKLFVFNGEGGRLRLGTSVDRVRTQV